MEIQVIASSSKGNAYRISDGQTALLLEAGIPIKEIQRALNFKLSQIDGCLVSHEHQDHSKAVKDLIKKGIEVYSSAGTLKALGLDNHRINILEFDKEDGYFEHTINTFKVLPFSVQHDAMEPVGFLIESTVTRERLLFFTDSHYIKFNFASIHYLMAECNYSADILTKNVNDGKIPESHRNRVIRSHMSLETLIDFIKACDTNVMKKIYLMHLSDGNSNELEFKQKIQKLTGIEVEVC